MADTPTLCDTVLDLLRVYGADNMPLEEQAELIVAVLRQRALLIEDREAARGRIVAELLEAFGVADEGLQVISSGRFGFRPEREWVLSLAAKVLRAAAGENG